PKNKFVNNIERTDTTTPSMIPIFKVIRINKAVIGWIFGKIGNEKANRPTVVSAVIIANKAMRSTVKYLGLSPTTAQDSTRFGRHLPAHNQPLLLMAFHR